MKNKRIKNKNKILISLVALFSALMCVSVGFASWITTGGSVSSTNGIIETDYVQGDEYVDVVTISSLQDYEYKEAYGFVDDGIFGNVLVLTGECSFDSENAREYINSYKTSKRFDLEIELSTTLTGGFAANDISSTTISASSSNFNTISATPTNGETILATLPITCSNNNSDFDFTFSISLVWSGGALSLFPDYSTAIFTVSLLPKEHEA